MSFKFEEILSPRQKDKRAEEYIQWLRANARLPQTEQDHTQTHPDAAIYADELIHATELLRALTKSLMGNPDNLDKVLAATEIEKILTRIKI